MSGPAAAQAAAAAPPAAVFAEQLTALGVPIFTSPPGRAGDEFDHPHGWSSLTTEHNADRIARHRPGHALLGLMGGQVAAGRRRPAQRR